jgi:hypothetical protein
LTTVLAKQTVRVQVPYGAVFWIMSMNTCFGVIYISTAHQTIHFYTALNSRALGPISKCKCMAWRAVDRTLRHYTLRTLRPDLKYDIALAYGNCVRLVFDIQFHFSKKYLIFFLLTAVLHSWYRLAIPEQSSPRVCLVTRTVMIGGGSVPLGIVGFNLKQNVNITW